MPLAPLAEQLDLPAQSVELRDRECWQHEVVGQKHQRLARLGVFASDSSQRRVEALVGVKTSEPDRLVADQACASVDRLRVAALGVEIGLGAKDKEAARGGVSTQALEVQIAPIHYIEGPRLEDQLSQHVDLVEFAVADEDERRNVAAQIQEGVQFDRRVGRACNARVLRAGI